LQLPQHPKACDHATAYPQAVSTQQAASLAAIRLSSALVLQGLQLTASIAAASAQQDSLVCLAARGSDSPPMFGFLTASGVGVSAVADAPEGASRRRLTSARVWCGVASADSARAVRCAAAGSLCAVATFALAYHEQQVYVPCMYTGITFLIHILSCITYMYYISPIS
jgi:hypothetical protein